MAEVWTRVVGFNKYEVSSHGRVRRISTMRILKPSLNIHGYPFVGLHNNKKTTSKSIHRLMGVSFGLVRGRQQINHIDGVKTNNHISNLEKSTYSKNISHAYRLGLMTQKGSKNNNSKLTEKEVLEIRSLHNKITNKKIGEIFNVSRHLISMIGNRKIWKHI